MSESTPSDLYACKQKTVLLVASRWWRVIGIDEQGNEHITLETSNEKSAHWGLENCPYPAGAVAALVPASVTGRRVG